MKEYIATFYSHFGAMQFKKACEARDLKAVIMPVPRKLSSSCGTCVRFEAEDPEDFPPKNEEIEQIVRAEGEKFISVWQSEE